MRRRSLAPLWYSDEMIRVDADVVAAASSRRQEQDEHFLRPWGYVLSGEAAWFGEELDDCGDVMVRGNTMRVAALTAPSMWNSDFWYSCEDCKKLLDRPRMRRMIERGMVH